MLATSCLARMFNSACISGSDVRCLQFVRNMIEHNAIVPFTRTARLDATYDTTHYSTRKLRSELSEARRQNKFRLSGRLIKFTDD